MVLISILVIRYYRLFRIFILPSLLSSLLGWLSGLWRLAGRGIGLPGRRSRNGFFVSICYLDKDFLEQNAINGNTTYNRPKPIKTISTTENTAVDRQSHIDNAIRAIPEMPKAPFSSLIKKNIQLLPAFYYPIKYNIIL